MKLTFAAAAMALGFTVFSAGAQAGVVMDISQVGGDVVATASGTLNLDGLSFLAHDKGAENAFVFPTFGAVGVGPAPLTPMNTAAGSAAQPISGPASAQDREAELETRSY